MNHNFTDIFGLESSQVRKNCILVPFYFPHMLELFQIDDWKKGQLFACGNNENFTLIHTRIGAPFVGDAVLYLNETKCENLYFLGSCGLIKQTGSLKIGSLVIINKAYALESFSEMLLKECDFNRFTLADEDFVKPFVKEVDALVNAGSLGSIRLETTIAGSLLENRIDVVDMETAAFLHAAKHIKRKAAALLFITDILNETSPFSYAPEHKDKIIAAQSSAVHLLMKTISASNNF